MLPAPLYTIWSGVGPTPPDLQSYDFIFSVVLKDLGKSQLLVGIYLNPILLGSWISRFSSNQPLNTDLDMVAELTKAFQEPLTTTTVTNAASAYKVPAELYVSLFKSPKVPGIGSSVYCRARLDLRLKLNYWPTTMPIVPGFSKLHLTAFHLGQTSYGGSKVPYRFLSLDTLWTSHFRSYRGISWPGWLSHFTFRRLGVPGQEPRQELRLDTDLGDEY